jgi:hypothetical protein
MLTFWNKLISSNKLSSKIARLLYILNINGTQGFKWIAFVKSTIDEIGLDFMYSVQQYASADWLKTYAKQILRDPFIQKWNSVLSNTSKGQLYLSFKSHFIIEPYLLRLKPIHRMFITKLTIIQYKIPDRNWTLKKYTKSQ